MGRGGARTYQVPRVMSEWIIQLSVSSGGFILDTPAGHLFMLYNRMVGARHGIIDWYCVLECTGYWHWVLSYMGPGLPAMSPSVTHTRQGLYNILLHESADQD